jgi:hypothetical protein
MVRSVVIIVAASVITNYVIREIETGFWRSRKIYEDTKSNFKGKFKRAEKATA